MSAPQIDNRISLGNIITAGAMVVAMAVGWGKLSSGQNEALRRIEVNVIRTDEHETRLRALENTASRQDERLLLILDNLREIKETLKGPRQ